MSETISIIMRGVFPAFPTIFDKYGKIQLDDMGNLLKFAKDSNVDGICLHMIGGEYYKLDLKERKKIIVKTVDLIPSNLPVYVNASSQSLNGSMEIINLCEQVGVNGIILNSPFFSPLSREIAAYRQMTTYLISKTKLPVVIQIYNSDAFRNNDADLDDILSNERVQAIKIEGVNYMDLAKEIMRIGKHVSILGGMYSYELELELESGFSGTVPGLSIAKHVKKIILYYEEHKMNEFKSCLHNLRPIQRLFIDKFDLFPYFERFALYKMGLISTIGYRMPAQIPSENELKEFEEMVKNILLHPCRYSL